MDRFSSHVKRFGNSFFQSFTVGFLFGLVLIVSRGPQTARADVPNFPSPTPTITPTRTITPTLAPTEIPTATSTTLPTLTPIGLAAGQEQNQQPVPPTAQPIPPQAGAGGIGCWPIGLFFLLAVILGVTYYFTRQTHSEAEEYNG